MEPHSPGQQHEEIIKTGFTPEDLESDVEGRSALAEFEEDYEVLGTCLSMLQADVASVRGMLAKTGKHLQVADPTELHQEGTQSPDILGQLETNLDSLCKQWELLGQQGSLFPSIPDNAGHEVSDKLYVLNDLKTKLRDWFVVAAGFRNVLEKVTHEFQDVRDFSKLIFASDADRTQWYSRGFSESVYGWEQEFAKEMDVPEVALCNSGMSAIEAACSASNLQSGDVIFVGKDFYPSTPQIFDSLKQRGVEVVQIDITNPETLQAALEQHQPKLLFLEGIGNAETMETADIAALLEQNSQWNEANPDAACRLILDNTFASTALLNVPKLVQEKNLSSAKWAVAESATKYYQRGMDNVTAGLVYSNDPEFMKQVKARRKLIGTHLQDKLCSYLPKPDAEILAEKMVRHSMNAMLLSTHLEKLGLKVSYPGLESHPQHGEAKKNYPEGQGGVFYINWDNNHGNPQDFVNTVHEEAQKIGSEIKIGVSFGHPETWLETMPPDFGNDWQEDDKRQWAVRVMAGVENVAEMKKVLQSFETAYTSVAGLQ